MSLPKEKVIDLTMDDDDEDAKMMKLENETGGNQLNESIVFDDDDEIRYVTENEYNVYIKDKENELKLYDIFIGKFLGKGWKKISGDEFVMMAMELRKKKEYAVFLKHNEDSHASRHERRRQWKN